MFSWSIRDKHMQGYIYVDKYVGIRIHNANNIRLEQYQNF